MISADDLFDHARAVLVQAGPAADEALLRRAVSTAYYALFHLLTLAGSSIVAGGAEPMAAKVARSYTHSAMQTVCSEYLKCTATHIPPKLQDVVSGKPDARLTQVAGAFVELQASRHKADYDLASDFQWRDVLRLFILASAARDAFNAIRDLPETRTFLVALLLADRWSRRG